MVVPAPAPHRLIPAKRARDLGTDRGLNRVCDLGNPNRGTLDEVRALIVSHPHTITHKPGLPGAPAPHRTVLRHRAGVRTTDSNLDHVFQARHIGRDELIPPASSAKCAELIGTPTSHPSRDPAGT